MHVISKATTQENLHYDDHTFYQGHAKGFTFVAHIGTMSQNIGSCKSSNNIVNAILQLYTYYNRHLFKVDYFKLVVSQMPNIF